MKYNVAQINIAHAKDSMESETMKGFVDRLDEINKLADTSPGFVWRIQTEEGIWRIEVRPVMKVEGIN